MAAVQYTDVVVVEEGQGQGGEVLQMGPVTIRILEDGRNTDNRIGSMVLTIQPRTPGPPIHWHRMHDETFLITSGRVRFTTIKAATANSSAPGGPELKSDESLREDLDAKAGDYVVVPTRSIHTFSNPWDEEASFFNTFTPAYYVDYLRMLAKAINEAQSGGKKLTEDEQREVMAQFATFEP
ncbi:hypothetical protein LZ554_008728 [Drepanopeziza brunnea f. sp. 'monogermtubi']|nr:hypothetical protein LZ554_008728 [Drepanopeziza brunnea f. sp. 'monogermtubi']